ncbi:hypothetical protein [Bacillus gaemokensis]|uniref:Lipoprotein n=1 Tax=Bacillus gaemokensis TaxID=574375 RepID=A0A073K1H5_9BACI|nr:hypothetical protein [Bacillus gaemokensis]KEK21179.1 hypothetical protein BAGA_28900 [Bacillus gaemokensis]KYG30463.1 hypothetical protein AZF08_27775 [Bacillus gaemokensis]
MLKKFCVGLLTTMILLSTNGIADASTGSLYAKDETITKNTKIATASSKTCKDCWHVGEYRIEDGVAARLTEGDSDVIEITVKKNGKVRMDVVGTGFAVVKVTQSNGKSVYYEFEVI